MEDFQMLMLPASLLTRADIEREAAETSLDRLLTQTEALAGQLEGAVKDGFRREETKAADEACALVTLACDALRAGRDKLRGLTAGDMLDELADAADAARAEARRHVS